MCVELKGQRSAADKQRIERELRGLAESVPRTRAVSAFLFHHGFPVDIRHNAKIGREELARWAARRLGHKNDQLALRSPWMIIPILGWLFVFYGLFFPLSPVLRALWSIDVFLSVVVHGLQLLVSLPHGKRAGFDRPYIVLMTFLFGATWWKPLR